MYSWEIEQLIKFKNYLIDVEDYIKILNTSPQIREVKYNPYENNFKIYTEDNLDIKFNVKKRERR